VLYPRRYVDIGQATSDGDDAAGEVALLQLPYDTVDAEGGVATDSTTLVHGQRRAQLGFVESVDGMIGTVPSSGRCATEQTRVRRLVVVLVEEGQSLTLTS